LPIPCSTSATRGNQSSSEEWLLVGADADQCCTDRELALVTFAAETFTEIGMKVKVGSPARYTLFASVSDGCISYLHTAESHAEGGYEVDVAPLAYRYPGRLQAGCEQYRLEPAQNLVAILLDSTTVGTGRSNIARPPR
jgi:hypothetical protein